jgi:hypothetical protein
MLRTGLQHTKAAMMDWMKKLKKGVEDDPEIHRHSLTKGVPSRLPSSATWRQR